MKVDTTLLCKFLGFKIQNDFSVSYTYQQVSYKCIYLIHNRDWNDTHFEVYFIDSRRWGRWANDAFLAYPWACTPWTRLEHGIWM